MNIIGQVERFNLERHGRRRKLNGIDVLHPLRQSHHVLQIASEDEIVGRTGHFLELFWLDVGEKYLRLCDQFVAGMHVPETSPPMSLNCSRLVRYVSVSPARASRRKIALEILARTTFFV